MQRVCLIRFSFVGLLIGVHRGLAMRFSRCVCRPLVAGSRLEVRARTACDDRNAEKLADWRSFVGDLDTEKPWALEDEWRARPLRTSSCWPRMRKSIKMQILPVPDLLHAAHIERGGVARVSEGIVCQEMVQIEGNLV